MLLKVNRNMQKFSVAMLLTVVLSEPTPLMLQTQEPLPILSMTQEMQRDAEESLKHNVDAYTYDSAYDSYGDDQKQRPGTISFATDALHALEEGGFVEIYRYTVDDAQAALSNIMDNVFSSTTRKYSMPLKLQEKQTPVFVHPTLVIVQNTCVMHVLTILIFLQMMFCLYRRSSGSENGTVVVHAEPVAVESAVKKEPKTVDALPA